MLQGGVDLSLRALGRPTTASGGRCATGSTSPSAASASRGAVGCSDRGHTAASQLKPGDIDWDALFGSDGARWFHTGGIFAALSETTAESRARR